MEINWFSNSPLVIGLVSAILGGMVTLVPWIHEKRKNKKIVEDGFGQTFLYSHISDIRISFNKTNPSLVDIKLVGGTYYECEAWISLNRGGGRLETVAKGVHNGVFSGVVRGLVPNNTYYFRTESKHDGRLVSGPASHFNFGNITTTAERDTFRASPHFSEEV